MNIDFEKNKTEEYFQESIKNPLFKTGIEKVASTAHELTLKGFEKLYEKLKFEKPDYNILSRERISDFCQQIKASKAMDDAEKVIFFIHLYANNSMTSEARALIPGVSGQKKKNALECLIEGTDDSAGSDGELLEEYFQVFPSSCHFRANLAIAKYYYAQKKDPFIIKMHLDRAFKAVPYNEELLKTYLEIFPGESSIETITKLICGEKK